MKHFKLRLSLRIKLLLLLVSLPLISLGLYLAMATDLFQKDKVAYVYDSSATVSRSLATQTRMEIGGFYANVRTVAEHFDAAANDFSAVGRDLFAKNARLQALILLRRSDAGEYLKLGQLAKDIPAAQNFLNNSTAIDKVRAGAVANAVYLSEMDGSPNLITAAFRLGEKEEPNHSVALAVFQAEDLLNAFQMSGIYSSFVVTRGAQVAIGALDVVSSDLDILQQPVLKNQIGESTTEVKLSDGVAYLISYATVGAGDLMVISKVDKNKALKAVEVLLAKSLLFFVLLLASTLLISVFASNQLTSTLRELYEATRKVAQGDFDIRVVAKSRDEVGGLAESFNWMAAEVARLLKETAEKARMESELSTVRTVQETLFPPSQSQFGPIRICGHFEPASECGGDWWNYSRVGNQIFLWIGDATGHGAPAALITSAARSAAAVIETLPDVTPGKALSILNRAIHQTSKGQIMMTFFVACIDLDKNQFSYSSASHDPPYLMRKTGELLMKKDLTPLNEVNGPRLGESKDHVYQDMVLEFTPGDILFLYTDGILDVENPEGKKWGERAFLKTLVDSANAGTDLNLRLEGMRTTMNTYRKGANLIDDVTMVMCEYEKRVA
jgi:sigma-B regulation protein RsbU (phosphoserine phosphatase)